MVENFDNFHDSSKFPYETFLSYDQFVIVLLVEKSYRHHSSKLYTINLLHYAVCASNFLNTCGH